MPGRALGNVFHLLHVADILACQNTQQVVEELELAGIKLLAGGLNALYVNKYHGGRALGNGAVGDAFIWRESVCFAKNFALVDFTDNRTVAAEVLADDVRFTLENDGNFADIRIGLDNVFAFMNI